VKETAFRKIGVCRHGDCSLFRVLDLCPADDWGQLRGLHSTDRQYWPSALTVDACRHYNIADEHFAFRDYTLRCRLVMFLAVERLGWAILGASENATESFCVVLCTSVGP
jgi:hypothetical protein